MADPDGVEAAERAVHVGELLQRPLADALRDVMASLKLPNTVQSAVDHLVCLLTQKSGAAAAVLASGTVVPSLASLVLESPVCACPSRHPAR